MNTELLRKIPKIDLLLSRPLLRDAPYPYELIRETAQGYTEELRNLILNDSLEELPETGEIEREILGRLSGGEIFSLRRVINATGVVLHTNLGRAPLGPEIAQHIAEIASSYCNLEYDLQEGCRGSRYSHVEKLICALTGAEAAMVVNNNAGAVFLMLNTLAKGRKTAVSRGELVEIGGSFRVPEIMAQSGAELMEVGTTNKTHAEDYARAIDEGAEVLLKVHTSNFKITGFTESVDISALKKLAEPSGALVLYDLGSGFLFPSENLGLHGAGKAAGKYLRDGADIVCFSGDKLLGSAQAGIIAGRKEYIDRMKKNHLARILRIDKLSLAALEISLKYMREPAAAAEHIPALGMLSKSRADCIKAAEKLKGLINRAAPEADAETVLTEDEAGGGSLPGLMLEGAALAVTLPGLSAEDFEKELRNQPLPVIARINRERLLFSARTLMGDDSEQIAAAVGRIAAENRGAEK